MVVNPFHPSFGVSPPVLVGRDVLLADFDLGLLEGPGALERSTLYVGARGLGKTVMLREVAAAAAERGWVTLSETATPGLIDRLVSKRFPRALRELDPDAKGWRLTGGSVAGFGADWQATERYRYEPGVREMWEDLCTVLARSGRGGVLITIDEVHGDRAGKVRDELRDLGAAFQHLRGEEHQVAFVAAGLPNAVEDVLNDDVLTFLRRGARYDLAMIGDDDRRYALEEPIRANGRSSPPTRSSTPPGSPRAIRS